MSKINIDQKSKSIRKYAGRTIALEKQNYKTSKIAWDTYMTPWTFLINCRNWRNWIIYIHVWDTNQSFHTEKGVIFFLNYYSWKNLACQLKWKEIHTLKSERETDFWHTCVCIDTILLRCWKLKKIFYG